MSQQNDAPGAVDDIVGESGRLLRSHGAKAPFYGWTLLVVLWLALGINFALTSYGLSILNVHMGDDLGFSRAALGTAYATFMLMTGLPGPLVAKLIGIVGIRKTLVIGNLLMLAGAVSMATIVTSPIILLLIAGIVMGLANAVAGPIPVQASVTRWFSRRRSLAMALVISGTSVAGVVFPPLLEKVVALSSWRMGWWLVAALAVVASIVCLVMVKEQPEDIGQYPDGMLPSASPGASGQPDVVAKVYQTQEEWFVRDVVRAPVFWILLACTIGVSAVYTLFLAQGVLHIRDLGYSTERASYLLSFSVGLGFVARLIAGYLGDRVDPSRMWSIGLISQAVGIVLFAHAQDVWMLYLSVGLIGIGDGNGILCLIMVFGNWFGTRAAPFVFGFGSAFAAAFGSLTPIVSGISYDRVGSFAPVFYVVGALCFASAITLFLLKPPRIRPA